MRVAWDFTHPGPYAFGQGTVAEGGTEVHTLNQQLHLELPQAVGLFAQNLPLKPGRWLMVWPQVSSEGEDVQRVLTGVWRPDWPAPRWDGCKVAFDLLRKMWSPEDVDWWATIAENYELQEL